MTAIAIRQLEVSTAAFKNEAAIPSRYTCEGEGINPQLDIKDLPEGTKTLALIVEDPDTAKGTYDHWVVWNIAPTNTIKENSNPGTSGNNSAGKTGYHPPCPPSGTHRYFFNVYALDTELDLMAGASKEPPKLLDLLL